MDIQVIALTQDLLAEHYLSYLDTLSHLSPVWHHTKETVLQTFSQIHAQWTMIFVAYNETTPAIVWTISVLIEHKLNRWWSRVAHLEDLAVHQNAQGQWVGRQLIMTAIDHAKTQNCYKIILDADKDPTHGDYYAKFWFEQAGIFMKMAL